MSIEMFGDSFNLVAGLKLPTLFIEQATVNDSNVDIKVSFYVRVEVDKFGADIIDDLSDIKFYIQQVLDGSATQIDFEFEGVGDVTYRFTTAYTDDELEGTTRYVDLISNNTSVMEFYAKLLQSHMEHDFFDWGGTHELYGFLGSFYYWVKQPIELTVDDFMEASVEIEDNNAYKIIKYTAETKTTLTRSHNPSEVFSEPGTISLGLVTFTTPLEMNGDNLSTLYDSVVSSPRLINFYNPFFSQLSYQKIFENGALMISPTKIFTYEDGRIYNDDAIQTIDGDFHTSARLTRQEIINQLSIIATTPNDSSQAFVEALNGYNYILAVYGDTEELLPRLDLFRKSYLDKSSVTAMGSWYLTFNQTLIRINSAVMQTPVLRRELVTTPVVVDNRTLDEGSYTQPGESTYSLETDYLFTNEGSVLMSRLGHFSTTEYGATVEPHEFENDYTLIENGFFFFDYEKAVRTQSVISKVFDINNVHNLLGTSSLNQYYKLSEVAIKRTSSEDNIIFNKISTFADSVESTYPAFEQMTYVAAANSHGSALAAKSSFDYYETTIYPELMLRNSVLPTNSDYDEYRLMTFQFQDIMPSDGFYGASARDDDTLSFTIDCKDYTKQLINVITASYVNYATGSFAEYLASAEDFCSYNNIDGYFNDFFVESMEADYVDDPQSAPWVVMPVIYNMHMDLVNGTFGGSMDKITDASIILSQQIAPATGRLEELQTFNNNLQTITDFYNGATFTGIMDSYDSEETIKFGGEISESVGSRFGLPDFLNLSAELTLEDASADVSRFNTGIDGTLTVAIDYIVQAVKNKTPGLSSDDEDLFESTLTTLNTDMIEGADELIIMISDGTLEDILEDDRLSYTEKENAVVMALEAAGVGTAAALAYGAATTTYFAGAAGTGAAAFGAAGATGAVNLGAIGGLSAATAAAAPILIIAAALVIFLVAISKLVKTARRDFLHDEIDQFVADAINQILVNASILQDSGAQKSVTFPTDPREALIYAYNVNRDKLYLLYLMVVYLYDQIDPDEYTTPAQRNIPPFPEESTAENIADVLLNLVAYKL